MKISKLAILALATLLGASAYGQTFAQVSKEAEQELRATEKELSDLRRSIADQKIPISKRLTQLENEVQQERKEYDRVVRAADNVDVDLRAMQEKVKSFQDENIFLKNTLSGYIKSFNTQIHAAEFETYKPLIDESQAIAVRPDATDSEKLSAQITVLEAALDRIKKIAGGHKFQGKAFGKGVEVNGNYVLVGPFAFFGDAADNVGFAESETNSAYPIIMNQGIDQKVLAAIAGLVEDGEGSMPVDPTEVNAIKMEMIEETFMGEVDAGGPVMLIILALAAVALLVAIFKFIDINTVKRPKPGTLQQIIDSLNGGNKQRALELANAVDGPFGDLLVAGVENADKDKELLEEVLYERLLAAQPKLERFLAFIALTAASAPLLGLLGTVTGMINTFALITVFGTGDAKKLSSGISEALITTKYGLLVAIPALLAQALLTRLAKGKLGEMEQTSVALVNGLENKED